MAQITNGTIGRVAVRYPDRLRITAQLDDVSKKYYGICDEMHNGQYIMNAFKTKPLFNTEEIAIQKTDLLCQEMKKSHDENIPFVGKID